MIYLDSSALLKLIFEEPESAALDYWLAARRTTPVVSSELAKVEVIRATRRVDATALPVARALLSQLDLIALRGQVLEVAGDVGGPQLRSLDAIHLASALAIGTEVSAFIAYDHRLIAAAQSLGLPVLHPADLSEPEGPGAP